MVSWRAAGPVGGIPGSANAWSPSEDPYGPFLLWMQLRTRALDDVLSRFVSEGGRQVVLLGAGYDCRARRFADVLGETHVFEVDHPATQAKKKAFASGHRCAAVSYVEWDFEQLEHRGCLLALRGTRTEREYTNADDLGRRDHVSTRRERERDVRAVAGLQRSRIVAGHDLPRSAGDSHPRRGPEV